MKNKINENQEKILCGLKKGSFKKRRAFTSVSIKIWNNLCHDCKMRTLSIIKRNQGTPDIESFCPKCQVMAREFEEEMNEAINK